MSYITITEANAALDGEIYTDWENLDDPFKQLYLDRASDYVYTKFIVPEQDTEFDWTDQTTWENEARLESAIAQYADAERAGRLYPQPVTADKPSAAPVTRKTVKAGSLETTTEYAQSDVSGLQNTLKHIDDLMAVLGFTKRGGGTLTRV